MYQINDIGSAYLSLPPNLQTLENEAYFYAVDRQMKKVYELAMRVNIWSDLDNVNPRYYDRIAACLRAPYYKSECTNRQKLALIKSTLLTYRYAGTVRGVEELLRAVFNNAEFIPWYKYGGEPYHFKVTATKQPSADDRKMFEEILRKIKAARSIIDYVEVIEDNIRSVWYVGLAVTVGRDIRVNREELEYDEV